VALTRVVVKIVEVVANKVLIVVRTIVDCLMGIIRGYSMEDLNQRKDFPIKAIVKSFKVVAKSFKVVAKSSKEAAKSSIVLIYFVKAKSFAQVITTTITFNQIAMAVIMAKRTFLIVVELIVIVTFMAFIITYHHHRHLLVGNFRGFILLVRENLNLKGNSIPVLTQACIQF